MSSVLHKCKGCGQVMDPDEPREAVVRDREVGEQRMREPGFTHHGCLERAKLGGWRLKPAK